MAETGSERQPTRTWGFSPGSLPESPDDDRAVEEIVRRGPAGAFAVAGVATAIVVAIYVLFYLFVYLPRGAVS